MQTGLAETVDLFRKWFSESALIRCDFSFASFAATVRGRIRLVGSTDITVVSDDANSEVVFRLGTAVRFEFTDSRNFPDEVMLFDFSLIAFLTDVEGSRDFISFTQIIENQEVK